jgi:hypothetical protein
MRKRREVNTGTIDRGKPLSEYLNEAEETRHGRWRIQLDNLRGWRIIHYLEQSLSKIQLENIKIPNL